MILDNKLIQIKNIIFLKIIINILLYTLFIIIVNTTVNNLSETSLRNHKAEALLKESQSRLNALSIQSNALTKSVEEYNSLINGNFLSEDCFNKNHFQDKVVKLQKKYDLKDSVKIFVSSNFITKGPQSRHTIATRSTVIQISYFTDTYLKALQLAEEIYNIPSQYKRVLKIEVKDYETLTPQVAQWLLIAEQPNLVISNLNIEIREISFYD